MKNLILTCSAAGALLFSLAGCSSTTTETTDTAVTTETVTPEMAVADTGTSQAATATDARTNTGATTGGLSNDPTNFILLAGSLDLLETQSSNQALALISNPDVRNFAQVALSDHRRIALELRGLAQKKNLIFPTVMLPKHQLMLNRLTEEKSKDFDKTYMELQEAAHKEYEELFEDASKRHSDPEMKAFASQNLATVRSQLESTRKNKRYS